MNAAEVSRFLGGELSGNPDMPITGVAGVNDAKEGDATFLADKKHLNKLKETPASCIIVKEFVEGLHMPQIKVPDPYYAFTILLRHFYVKPLEYSGVSSNAVISKTAEIGEGVTIMENSHICGNAVIGRGTYVHPLVFIGEGAIIGEDCIIYPNVVIRDGVAIGNRVIIHPSAVIGADGFGFIFRQGAHQKIPQVGGVSIGDDVEIGACVCIDRATTGNTVIGKGTKIDNLVQIGHNVKVGENCIIVGQVGIGGSTVIGNYVTIGGQVAISDHSTLEDGVMIAGQSGVVGNLSNGVYSGSPAIEHKKWLKSSVLFGRLPELYERIKKLESIIDETRKERK